ncbi:ABC transporter ATP-binding protein [Lachnospiraceae bacterium 56-18]|jgi:ABC-type lipoprotein export system ATPase subunit|nr:ABC transporter ATP-binding protein [Hungatella sp.]
MEIRLNNIKKSYENQEVLKGIDLTVGQGDYISIIGRSGCGKTTLLKIIGLLTVPTDGELLIDGKSYSDLWKDELADIRRRNMGFVFQDYLLLEDLSALDNMMLPGLLEKMDGGSSRKRAYELAEYLEIEKELLERYPGELSGGEKQRIAIARALFNDPPMLLADEPTGNLDENTRKIVEDIFCKLHRTMNKTILLVTHDLEFAKKSERQYRIKDGILQRGR